MRVDVRLIIVGALASALYLLVDAVKCAVTGTYFGRESMGYPQDQTDTALALEQAGEIGRFIDYGAWAAYASDFGIDVHRLWPFFVVLAVVGVVGLWRFLCAELVGWALLVAFGVCTALRGGWFALIPGALLVVLFLPSTLRLLFEYRDRPMDSEPATTTTANGA